jgi:hypothetical protein
MRDTFLALCGFLGLGFAAGLLLSSDAHAQERTTVGDALRRVTTVVIPSLPLPVEKTVADSLLKRIPSRAHLAERGGSGAPRAGEFIIRIERGGEDTSAGWFRFSIAPDGTGELTASRPHLLYGALCRVLEEWEGDDVQKHATARKEVFRLPWLEGNDGLFVGVPRFIRNYDPEATIRGMARLGCSHVSVNVLAATEAAEQGVPGEDYPRFYVYSPDIDQFVETDLTRGLYRQEYLQANLDLLKKNASLAEAYGLTPGLTVCSPRTMPDAFFTKYPYLRGARVDHPFRSYHPRYTATLSHPLVRWHYAQLMKKIMREVPQLGYLTLWTNDSGSGFEYVSTLYAGRNGGAYLIREWKSDSAIARAAGENVIRYLRLLRDAASETNSRFRVITSLAYFGSEKDIILNGLGDRLDLQVQAADTADAQRWSALRARGTNGPALFGTVRAAPNYVLGVPCPWLTFDRLSGTASGVANISVTFDPPSLAPWSVNREIIRAFQSRPGTPVDTIVTSIARRWCGADAAPGLVLAWRLADSAVRLFPDVPLYGNSWAFPWYRHWVRPFVPDIDAIPKNERAYYERHMIASFNNPTLVDFGADILWLLMDRESAASIVTTCDSLVWKPLDGAIRILDTMSVTEARKGGAGSGVLRDQRDRLVALRCYYRTLRNVAGWIDGVHGYIGARSAGERDRMLRAVRETIDDEVKNAGDLYGLWSTTRTEFMPVAVDGENWALYGHNFGDLLQKKIALMNQHRNDTPAIDPDFMWRVGPESPVQMGEYLRY